MNKKKEEVNLKKRQKLFLEKLNIFLEEWYHTQALNENEIIAEDYMIFPEPYYFSNKAYADCFNEFKELVERKFNIIFTRKMRRFSDIREAMEKREINKAEILRRLGIALSDVHFDKKEAYDILREIGIDPEKTVGKLLLRIKKLQIK